MPKFGSRSLAALSTCHPELQVLAKELIALEDFAIICGHRDEAAQHVAFLMNTSKVDFPNSRHNSNPSEAMDIVPWYAVAPTVRWPANKVMRDPDALVFARFAYMAGMARGLARGLKVAGKMSYDLRSGIDWNSDGEIADTKFFDLPHLELVK